MNTTESEEIAKLIQPNILPNSVTIVVSSEQNEVQNEEVTEKKETIVQDETILAPELDNAEMDEEEEETDMDFSSCNKLQLVELLEETVKDTDVVKIKNKVTAIKVHFLKLNKEDMDKELEQFILDGGDKDSYEHKRRLTTHRLKTDGFGGNAEPKVD